MIPTQTTEARLTALLRSCENNPVRFCKKILGWTTPHKNALWSAQRELASLIADSKIVVAPAGNSVGKSRLAAGLIAWWLLTRPNSMVLVTAPSQSVVGSIIFKELRRAIRHARFTLGGDITKSQKASPQTWDLGPGWCAIGFATNTLERASGQHSPQLLVLVDEASGVEPDIFEAIHSWNYTKLVLFGNPLRADGEFVKLYEQSKEDQSQLPPDQRTVAYVISTLDSPHAHQTKSPCGLADRTFIDSIARLYGIGSYYWRTHIGIDKNNPFPTSSHDILIPPAWVEQCTRPRRATTGGPRYMAVDVSKGSGGDRTIWLIGDMAGILQVISSNTTDIRTAALRVREYAGHYGIDYTNVVYDAGGWAGSDMRDYLAAIGIMSCHPYHGGDSGGIRFTNRRSLCAWRVRTRLDMERPLQLPFVPVDPNLIGHDQREPEMVKLQPPFHIAGNAPWWPELREGLLALRCSFDGKRTKLELKSELQLRLGYSPDILDSLIMAASMWQGLD